MLKVFEFSERTDGQSERVLYSVASCADNGTLISEEARCSRRIGRENHETGDGCSVGFTGLCCKRSGFRGRRTFGNRRAGPGRPGLRGSGLAGASDINTDPDLTAQINAELNANAEIFPSFALEVGPMVSFRLQSGNLAVLPGVNFSLKEGTPDYGKPLVGWGPEGSRIGGYWQGLWTFVNGRGVFIVVPGSSWRRVWLSV